MQIEGEKIGDSTCPGGETYFITRQKLKYRVKQSKGENILVNY